MGVSLCVCVFLLAELPTVLVGRGAALEEDLGDAEAPPAEARTVMTPTDDGRGVVDMPRSTPAE